MGEDHLQAVSTLSTAFNVQLIGVPHHSYLMFLPFTTRPTFKAFVDL